MYLITVLLGPHAFKAIYKQEKKAREAKAALDPNPSTALGSTEWINLEDDFGHELAIERKQLFGYIFEDLDQTKLAHVEMSLHQQRLQNLAQKTASADPGLRMAANGPAVFSPFGPPRN